ncbi:MAG: MarR family EPS-associated transcriptional regulator [Pseudohongiellaceae bacterium]|nr:MarR family EPS-associated transcriptional regulator [Pseudohongiellaceae bacterium]
MLSDEARYHILRRLETNPQVSQRELASELGISLGKVNYCLKALVEKGMIKARNFSSSGNKRRYLYVLTPSGLESKATITKRFLQRKLAEYEALKQEIEQLKQEAIKDNDRAGDTNAARRSTAE